MGLVPPTTPPQVLSAFLRLFTGPWAFPAWLAVGLWLLSHDRRHIRKRMRETEAHRVNLHLLYSTPPILFHFPRFQLLRQKYEMKTPELNESRALNKFLLQCAVTIALL
jgi:hypothetical protein